MKKEVKVGDYVEAGFRLKNGGTGLSRILGGGFIGRLTCSNGAVLTDWIGDPFSRKHLTGVQPIGVMPQYWDDPSRFPQGNPPMGITFMSYENSFNNCLRNVSARNSSREL
jgi:hypothetical protein